MKTEITIGNYRCFSEQRPARFVVGDGETAFVGINNSGKSTLLKFFFEMRGLWNTITHADTLAEALKGKPQSFGMASGKHVLHSFHSRSPMGMKIKISSDINSYMAGGGRYGYDHNRHYLPKELVIDIPHAT